MVESLGLMGAKEVAWMRKGFGRSHPAINESAFGIILSEQDLVGHYSGLVLVRARLFRHLSDQAFWQAFACFLHPTWQCILGLGWASKRKQKSKNSTTTSVTHTIVPTRTVPVSVLASCITHAKFAAPTQTAGMSQRLQRRRQCIVHQSRRNTRTLVAWQALTFGKLLE